MKRMETLVLILRIVLLYPLIVTLVATVYIYSGCPQCVRSLDNFHIFLGLYVVVIVLVIVSALRAINRYVNPYGPIDDELYPDRW